MDDSVGDRIGSWIGGLLLLFVFVVTPIGMAAGWVNDTFINPKYSCTSTPIPYKTVEIGKDSLALQSSTITTEGEAGEKRYCKPVNGFTEDKEIVVKQPRAEVVQYTDLPKPQINYTIPAPTYGGGAICMDGTRSYSTGRGTCSWHGGVDYWL